MVNFPGRNGRRRRVLNEDVLSASSSHAALRAMTQDHDVHDAPRYSDAASVENHPQVTDFIPRQYRTIALLVLIGLASAGMLGALEHFTESIAGALGMPLSAPFSDAPGNIAAWLASVLLLVASATCVLIYSIRRHRIDDYRGRYRIWLAAAAACLLVSLDSVTGVHGVLAGVLSHVTGWTALRGGAIWWLVLGGLPLAWIFVRALLDVKECRLAASLMVAALICFAISAASYFGAVPFLAFPIASTADSVGMLLGRWMLLAAVVSYARFVVLDAQGLIAVRRRPTRQTKKHAVSTDGAAAERQQPRGAAASLLSAGGYSRQRQSPQPASSPAAAEWVDGSRPERDSYADDDDDSPGDDRKLSKSERKRLRKLKAQNRVA